MELYFQHALSDANSETRQSARKAFLIWELKHPNSAKKMSCMLEISVQKALMDERDNFNP